MRKLLFAAALLAACTSFAQGDYEWVRGMHDYVDTPRIDTRTLLTGAWTCALHSKNCAAPVGTGNAVVELTIGDSILLQSGADFYSYTVESIVDADNFVREDKPSPGVTDALLAVAGSAMYELNTGVDSTTRPIVDGSSARSALGVSTTEIAVGEDKTAPTANLVGSMRFISAGNNAYSTTITPGTSTQSIAYVLPADDGGAGEYLKSDGSGNLDWDSPAIAEADTLQTVTTRGATTTTAVGLNGGFSVDTPAFVVADTTGALTTTGAIAANGGISVDTPAFVVTDTTGAVSTTSTISSGGLNTITIDGNNAATEFLQITNSNNGATGQTGDTAAISFDLYGSTDSGSTWVAREAARIEAYKVEDWWAGTIADFDSNLRFFVTVNGVPSQILSLFDGIDMDIGSGITVSGNGSFTGSVSASWGALKVDNAVAAASTVMQLSVGTNGLMTEGATADADELIISIPTYSDGGAGDQGGANDPTVYMAVASGDFTVTLGDEVTPDRYASATAAGPSANTASVALIIPYTAVNEEGDTNQVLTIGTLPAKSVLQMAYAQVVTAWNGAACTDVDVTIGATADNDSLLVTMPLLDASVEVIANTVYGDADVERGVDLPDADATGAKLYSITATQAFDISVTTTGCNTTALSQGSLRVMLVYTVLP